MQSGRIDVFNTKSAALLRGFLLLVAFAGVCSPARRAFDTVVVRSSLHADTHVDWSSAGALFNQVTDPFSVIEAGGITLSVSMPSGSFLRYDQGMIPNDFDGGWNGNFAPGDHLLYTGLDDFGTPNSGPITISFSQPIYGIGTQFQSVTQAPFTASIRLFDATHNLLASVSSAGLSNNHADNSAIFLGLTNASPSIYSVELEVTSPSDVTFAINTLELVTLPIPEPSDEVLLSIGVFVLAAKYRRTLRKEMHPNSTNR